MNVPFVQSQRLIRSIAGGLVVLTYGVIMALTANHAFTQAAPVPQRTWEPSGKAARVRRPMEQAIQGEHPNVRVGGRVTPLPGVNTAELRRTYMLSCPAAPGSDPIDAPRHPWPHTGEFVDDCSTTMAGEGQLLLSM